MPTDVQEQRVEARVEAEPPVVDAPERSPRLKLIVALSAVTGVIHAKAMVDHAEHDWLFGLFFGVLTYAQVLWAVRVWRRPDDRRWWTAVAAASLGIVGIWLVSRTVGLPFGPWANEAEAVGITDLAATLNEVVLAGLIFAMLRPDRRLAARLRWLTDDNCTRLGALLCALSLFAVVIGQHTHPTVN